MPGEHDRPHSRVNVKTTGFVSISDGPLKNRSGEIDHDRISFNTGGRDMFEMPQIFSVIVSDRFAF
jgi:hypothetical protein